MKVIRRTAKNKKKVHVEVMYMHYIQELIFLNAKDKLLHAKRERKKQNFHKTNSLKLCI